MKAKHLLASGGVAALLALGGASVASAAPGPWNDCSDFSTPVKIVGHYDPANLDSDHDGVGCEGNPGQAMAYDLYANLRDEGDSNPQPSVTAPSELAHTGIGPVSHPIRWMAGSVGLVALGTTVLFVNRRKYV